MFRDRCLRVFDHFVILALKGLIHLNSLILEAKVSVNPSRPNLGRREKIKLHFYFYTSLPCLKRF